MLREFVTRSPLLLLPLVAFVLFGTMFVAAVVIALKSRRGDVDHVSALPLSDGLPVSKESHDVSL